MGLSPSGLRSSRSPCIEKRPFCGLHRSLCNICVSWSRGHQTPHLDLSLWFVDYWSNVVEKEDILGPTVLSCTTCAPCSKKAGPCVADFLLFTQSVQILGKCRVPGLYMCSNGTAPRNGWPLWASGLPYVEHKLACYNCAACRKVQTQVLELHRSNWLDSGKVFVPAPSFKNFH